MRRVGRPAPAVQLLDRLGDGARIVLAQPARKASPSSPWPFHSDEAAGAVAEVVAVGADQPAGHHRERQGRRVAVLGFAGLVEALRRSAISSAVDITVLYSSA